jgi:hypothetical protein
MRTTLPLLLGFIAGVFAFGELYIPAPEYRVVFEHLRDFAQILASAAFILGGINVVQVNYPKIRRREEDWPYKVVMLASALIMGLSGVRWHAVGGERESGRVLVSGTAAAAVPARLRVQAADRDALVVIDGGLPLRAWHDGEPGAIERAPGSQPLELDLAAGEHTIAVSKPVNGYASYKTTLVVGTSLAEPTSAAATRVAPGQLATVEADLVMYWGAQSPNLGRVFTWLYDHVFFPCNATMFALLAFFIASAAFRAFRARNAESALLLGAAILVMIGLVPIGRALSPVFPEIEEWIMDVLNTTGRRAIMMGAALGAIATGLRVILGIERSHLGAE